MNKDAFVKRQNFATNYLCRSYVLRMIYDAFVNRFPAGKNYVAVVSSDASSNNMKDEAEMKNNFK